MVTEALPIDRIVRVNASISPSTPLRPDFGRTLLMTPSTLAPARTSTYASAVSVGRIFGTLNSSVYDKAAEYFGQTPYPKDLIIGRWAQATVNGRVTGGAHQTLAALQAVTAGAFTISGQASTTLSFATAANFAAVAALLQAGVQAIANPTDWVVGTAYSQGDDASGSDGQIYQAVVDNTGNDPTTDTGANWRLLGPQVDNATVAYTNGAFVITNNNLLPMTLPTGTVATAMGLTAAQGALAAAGFPADGSIVDAFNACVTEDGTFYWVGHDTAIADYVDGGVLEQLAAAVQASGRYQLDLNSYGPAPLVTNESVSFDARVGALGQNRVNRNWNGAPGQSIGIGIAAVMSTVNFNGVDTLVNPHGRPLRGFTPGRLTIAQANELERKRVNYFATIGPQSIYTAGTTGASGVWRDSQYFLDWLQEQVQLRVYNYIINNPTRVPQTDLGLQGVLAVIEQACRQGVRNGGIAQGFVSQALQGSIRRQPGLEDFNGFMEKGFLVYAPPFSTVADTDLRARKAPSPRVWIRGSGAINGIEIDMTFDG